MNNTKKLILASASPRRRELLHLITDNFEVITSDADENTDITDPADFVRTIAKRKAGAVFASHPDATVIGADTVVFAGGRILGKPEDAKQAEEYIRLLKGSTHSVFTGVCVMSGDTCDVRYAETKVTFYDMSEDEIADYMSKGDYTDKAGAYAVQGEAAKYIKKTDGCFYNVVGLPVSLLYNMLGKID